MAKGKNYTNIVDDVTEHIISPKDYTSVGVTMLGLGRESLGDVIEHILSPEEFTMRMVGMLALVCESDGEFVWDRVNQRLDYLLDRGYIQHGGVDRYKPTDSGRKLFDELKEEGSLQVAKANYQHS